MAGAVQAYQQCGADEGAICYTTGGRRTTAAARSQKRHAVAQVRGRGCTGAPTAGRRRCKTEEPLLATRAKCKPAGSSLSVLMTDRVHERYDL